MGRGRGGLCGGFGADDAGGAGGGSGVLIVGDSRSWREEGVGAAVGVIGVRGGGGGRGLGRSAFRGRVWGVVGVWLGCGAFGGS